MTQILASCSVADLPLKAAPINPDWVLAGAPAARNRELSHSADWGAWTMVWDCTGGRFEWRYDIDETVHFIAGSVTISVDGGPARLYGAGDVLFFPCGCRAVWEVHDYVRKVAFCRETLPRPLVIAQKIYRRLFRLLSPGAAKVGALEPAR